ncbi:protein of unknown function [Brevefilum fermentans]|jgi:hypothetical protein|uniref:Uncharacterized protein n=1 Tax=Candidatus Brevifilum fermentans TaxID=1986204 RepID=A0A1Y6K2V5_9CHLR|nr:protein of unknown function [Brevefilum fermentans]
MTHSVSVRLDEYMYIEGMGHQEDGHPHLEEILEETEADPVMQVVLFGDHDDQLVTKYEGDDDACNRDDHRLGERSDHAEDIAVPALWSLIDLFGDCAVFSLTSTNMVVRLLSISPMKNSRIACSILSKRPCIGIIRRDQPGERSV